MTIHVHQPLFRWVPTIHRQKEGAKAGVGVSVFRWLGSKRPLIQGTTSKRHQKKRHFGTCVITCVVFLNFLNYVSKSLALRIWQGLGLIGTPPASKKGLQNLCSKNQRLGIWGKGAFSLRCTGCHVLRWFPPQNQYPQGFHGMYSHTLTIL